MQSYMVVTVAKSALPEDLRPLWSPVLADEASAPDEYVGHTEGAVLDAEGHVVAFLVRLAPKLAAERPRILVAASAIQISNECVLRASWSEDQLRAQPRLDYTLQPHSTTDGAPPVESQWMPARPAVIPPGGGFNSAEAAKEGLQGGLAGVAIGALAGLAIGGPLGALGLAAFCAAGGSLAGVLAGASQDSAVEAGEMKFEAAAKGDKRSPALVRLEERLRDPALRDGDLLGWTPFAPIVLPPKTHSEPVSPNLH